MAPKKSTYAPANYGSVAEALVGLYGAVSYTHLTLPTICSV